MTVQTAVQTIADKLADAERRASQTIKDFRQLRDEFAEIADGTPGTGLITAAYQAKLVAVASTFGAEILSIHLELTNYAQQFGIDIPGAAPTDGEIGIMSGGR